MPKLIVFAGYRGQASDWVRKNTPLAVHEWLFPTRMYELRGLRGCPYVMVGSYLRDNALMGAKLPETWAFMMSQQWVPYDTYTHISFARSTNNFIPRIWADSVAKAYADNTVLKKIPSIS